MRRQVTIVIELPEVDLSEHEFFMIGKMLRANGASGQGLTIMLPEGFKFDGALIHVETTGHDGNKLTTRKGPTHARV